MKTPGSLEGRNRKALKSVKIGKACSFDSDITRTIATSWENKSALVVHLHPRHAFQEKKKTGTVFFDLTATYDTIWHTGLLYKMSGVLPGQVVMATELRALSQTFLAGSGPQNQHLEIPERQNPARPSAGTNCI